jgi:hypothetical protein
MTFSVYYFSNETLGNICECECRGVDADVAKKWFVHHSTNVAAKMGFTVKVIVADENGDTVAEWRYGKGVVWPPQEESGP